MGSNVPVGELIEYSIGGGWGNEDRTPSSDTSVCVVRGADFPSFSLPKRALPTRWETSKRAQKRYLKPGDIVLENSGGTKDRPTGRTIFVTGQNCLDNLIPASFCRLVRPNQALVVPRYLYYWLQEMYLAGRTWKYQNQSTGIANFQFDLFAKNEYVRLPAYDEQIAIAKVLGDIDDLQTNLAFLNDYLSKLLDTQFQQVLRSAGATTWEIGSLLDIAEYKNGLAMQHFRPVGNDPGLPVLKIRELGRGFCGSDSERCRSNLDSSVTINDGDLIFSWSGTLLLDFWTGGKAGLNQHLFKVTSDKYPNWFYYLWTKHHLRRFRAIAADKATTMGHIKRGSLADAKVAIPPMAEMEKLTEWFQPIINKIIFNRTESRHLSRMRDVLLPKLMSGEIDVSKVDITPPNNHLPAS